MPDSPLKFTEKSNYLPIIDITPYLDGYDSHGRQATSSAIHSACLEYGFFYLDISKYSDPSEPEELTRLAREFFALPPDEKAQIALKNEDGARGQLMVSALATEAATELSCQGMLGSRRMSRTARQIIMKELTFIGR